MPLVRVDMIKGKSTEYKKTVLDCIHIGLMESIGIEDWDRFQRIVEIQREDFETAPGKTDNFMIIELTLFPGRTKEQKGSAIKAITAGLEERLGIAPTDVFIVINEPPFENWGMGGKQKEKYAEYLASTDCIDVNNPVIQDKAMQLKEISESRIDYIKRAYEYVRDEIPHSWDIKSEIVSRKASEVLINKTGICWTKSCLLAALLRANGIPSGICYQLLTRADDDASEGYIIHALNTVFVEDLNRWIRLDARGNKENVHAQFSVDEEKLAFPIRKELGEIDYMDNTSDLDVRLIKILQNSNSVLEITTDFGM